MPANVLLVHPKIPSSFNGAPMGLLYIGAYLREKGYDLKIIDMHVSSFSEFEETMTSFRPSVVGITSTSPSHKAALGLAKKIKQQYPDVIIVKGGIHETYCARHTLATQPYIDYSVIGEADVSFSLLVQAIEGKQNIDTVPGIAFRSNSDIEANPVNEALIELDRMPIPDRSLLKETPYYNFRIFNYRKTAQLQTMRGCPFKCSFCSQKTRSVLYRSNNRVVEELKLLKIQGYEAIFFDDATFTANLKKTSEFAQQVISEGFDFQFGCQTRSDSVNSDVLSKMSSAGFSYISFGLETTDEKKLKELSKTIKVKQHVENTAKAVQLCREHNIKSCLNLILGLPGETNETLKNMFEYVNLLDPDYVSLSILALYPHQDPSTAQVYCDGVSEEPIWQNFDEGYGAIHPNSDAVRAEEILSIASSSLGEKLNLV